MQGHGFDDAPLPFVPTGDVIVGSGGLYSSARGLLRWLAWHLDRFGNERADERLIDRAAYLWRDGLQSVVGLDESGHMDAMGLAWVVMAPEGDRPLILQKAGGLQGILSYVAFAPSRNVGLMIAINAFYVNAGRAMASAANALIAELAPGQTREVARTQGGHQLADDTKFFRSATPRLCSRPEFSTAAQSA